MTSLAEQIAERIEWILRTGKISARELDRRSHLSPGQVSLLLTRLRKGDKSVTLKTLEAIAQGAGVALSWLAAGVGTLAQADDMPARASAAELARQQGVWHEATRSVLADVLAEGDSKRSVEWWLLRMELRELEMIEEAQRRAAVRETRKRAREERIPLTPAAGTQRVPILEAPRSSRKRPRAR